jgi:hypothetical protein
MILGRINLVENDSHRKTLMNQLSDELLAGKL